ncbi:hypothetical protein J6W78_05650 [bacterium]|nr:hypothetical protein [bacterium]
MARTALVLETNPVITERYLDYTHDSDWRIMLKDTLNDFLEKLQHEKFNLIVAEESLLPQGIIQMMKSTGIPFLLATNNKNPEIPTLPRNFNRTELLTVFGRLVPETQADPEIEDFEKEDTTINDLLSGLEDEEETFELSSDAVVTEPEKPLEEEKKNEPEDSVSDFFGDGELFSDEDKTPETPNEEKNLFNTIKPATEVSENKKSKTFNSPSFNNRDIDSFINSLSLDKEDGKTAFEKIMEEEPTLEQKVETHTNDKGSDLLFGNQDDNESPTDSADKYQPETTNVTANPLQNEVELEDNAEKSTKTGLSDDAIKAEVSAWLEKNARSIIKEIVMEQLASLSGKNND